METGFEARHPGVGLPAHLCAPGAFPWAPVGPPGGPPAGGRPPSTARSTSPGARTPAAGVPGVTCDTRAGDSFVPLAQKIAARMRKASTMLTNGPAAMTTIRFHT